MTRGAKEVCSYTDEHSKAVVRRYFSIFKDTFSHSQTAYSLSSRKKPKLSTEQGPDGKLSVFLAGTPGKYM